MRARIGRWGNSTALRIPQEIAAAAGLSEGTAVDVELVGDAIVIRRAEPRRRCTLDALLEGMTPEAMREAFDWGPDQGREVVP